MGSKGFSATTVYCNISWRMFGSNAWTPRERPVWIGLAQIGKALLDWAVLQLNHLYFVLSYLIEKGENVGSPSTPLDDF